VDVKTKIITQFVRDLSFENPNGPGSFKSGAERPIINANVDVKAQNRKDTNIYEVELNINVNAAHVEKSLYIIDLKYIGIFEIENLTDDVKEAYLLVECPRQLFPFARRIIYDLHTDGALPPLMLDPVNFAELYKKKTGNN
jgi:preprotein translocase subunit SecB